MNNDEFYQAYNRLRSDFENSSNDLFSTSDCSAPSPFPTELALELAREYEIEQNKMVEEGDLLAIELTDEKFQSWLTTFKKQYLDLINKVDFKLHTNDPIFCKVDAFSPVEWGLEEVPHTKMLAFFLDPNKEHGLEKLPMEFFLAALKTNEKKLEFDVSNYSEIKPKTIEAEKLIHIKGKEDRRFDVLITLSEPECRILIEGKINARQGVDQLPDYEKWFGPEKNDLLIYLTPEQTEEKLGDRWQSLTWKDVASAFCALVNYCETNKTVKEKISHDGFELLRLWTSTLLHHVCDTDILDYEVQDDSLLNVIAYSSHLKEVKNILDEIGGENNADQ